MRRPTLRHARPARATTALGVLALAGAALMGVVPAEPAAAASGGSAQVPGTTVIKGDTVPKVAHLGPATFTKPGPFGVGETTLALPANGAPVEVWYPATKASVAGKPVATYDVSTWLPPAVKKLIPAGFTVTYPSGGVTGVAVAPGRYPLVLFSHGYAGFRDQSTFLTSWLASWGFVVAAPDHQSRDLTQVLGGPKGTTDDVQDLQLTIALMTAQNGSPSSTFHGHIDTRLIGAVGHSAGGAAVEALAATDRRVTTFVGMAGATVGAFGQAQGGPYTKVPRQPGMLMSGLSDRVVPVAGMIKAYGKLHSPKRLILLKGAGHLVFADLCEVGAGQGGLLAIGNALKLPIPAQLTLLATDGCQAPDTSPPTEWPLIRQAVTAQIRHVFGFDATDAGLASLRAAYPGVVAVNRAS